MGKTSWLTNDLDGEIYGVALADGPLGLRKRYMDKTIPSTAYPSSEVLSQTWNLQLARKTGECLADDCIEKEADVLLAPGVNIKRSPICGRNFEYFSEDPYLSGMFAYEYIDGLQSRHVGATLKHFVANNIEFGRVWTDSVIDERTMHEIYMRAFEIALKAKPWAVMSSYNLVEKTHMSQNKKYIDILRHQLGHGNNLVMSDWDAVHDHTASVKAGTDLEMPYNKEHAEALLNDYREGRITESEIDVCAERVICFAEKCKTEKSLRKVTYTQQERSDAALKVAEEGIVLLKNTGGVLPIKNGQSVAVTANHFERQNYYRGGGSSQVELRDKFATIEESLKNNLSKSVVSACDIWGKSYPDTFKIATDSDVAVVICGTYATEGNDRRWLNLIDYDDEEFFIKEIAKRNKNTVVVMFGPGVIDVSSWIDDVSAVVYAGFPGERGNEAIANILTGKVTPSGKLTETFAKSREEYPSEHTRRDAFASYYDEGMNVGYRYFDKHNDKVRFPFGFGLSYTEFEYSDAAYEVCGEKSFVSLNVKNTGNTDGSEIVQVYVLSEGNSIDPIKQLKGFGKVFVSAGNTERIRIELDDRAFDYYSVEQHEWLTRTGEITLAVASSSQDVRLKLIIKN